MNTHIYSQGPNLFDPATNYVTTGKFISANGTITTSAPSYTGPDTYNYTDYIPVEAGITYKRVWHGPASLIAKGMSVAWYDNSEIFISRSNGSTAPIGSTDVVDTFTAPANAAYARINFCSETWPNSAVDLEFYDTAIEWRDYTPHSYTHGENLIDYTATDTDKGYVSGKYLNSDGSLQTPSGSTAWNISEYIDVSGISRIRVAIS